MSDLSNVKVGDELYATRSYTAGVGHILRVDRVSPTGRVTAGGHVFNKDGSERVSRGSWTRLYVTFPVTDEHRSAVYRRNVVAFLRTAVSWENLETGTLARCHALIVQDRERNA